jgi:integrase
MATQLTSQSLKSLKASPCRQEIRDGGARGLYVVVQPRTGEKSFVVRHTIGGKQYKKTIGYFPAMGLAEAREKAQELGIALRRGDPLPIQIGPPALGSVRMGGISVSEAWALYWKHEGSARKSASEKLRIFNRDVRPRIGDQLLSGVKRQDLAALISLKFETARTASNRLHSLLARFFRWCHTHGQPLTGLEANPMASIAKMHSERDAARTRYLNERELIWWFTALHAAGEYRPIHELLMRTLCRFSEIMYLAWGEVAQRENGDWVLSISDTKNNQAHLVYLHPTAFKLLPQRPPAAKPEDRVFKLAGYSAKPTDRIRGAMEGLAAEEGLTVPHWQPHDYRRTGTTHLASFLDKDDDPIVPEHILDRLLAHKEQRIIRHYNVHSYYKEKKKAIHNWNEWLDNLIVMSALNK